MRTPSQRKTETEIAYHSQSIACIVYTCDRRSKIVLSSRLVTAPDCPLCLQELPDEIGYMYIEDITRWREDMNFIFEWQNNILRTSAASE